MAGFSLDATLFLPKAGATDQQIQEYAEKQMRIAAKAFLRACLDRIPIRTGFLRGAFREINRYFEYNDTQNFGPILGKLIKEYDAHRQRLARLAKVTYKEIAAHEQVFAKVLRATLHNYHASPRTPSTGELYYPDKVLKSPVSGIPYAIPPGEMIKRVGSKVVFNLYINITYYIVNDEGSRIKGAPWRSLQAGVTAMVNALRKAKPPDFLKKSSKVKVSLRDSGISVIEVPNG